MNYNAVISVEDITDESGVFEEPVAIDEVKDYLRLEGYVDSAESTTDDLSNFDFDDKLIAELIKGGRELMEQKAGISMLPKKIQAVITNLCGMVELPYGPIGTITELLDHEGTEITSASYKLVGNKWKYLAYPCYCNMTITYTTGYDVLPKAIKIDLLRLVAYMYENRGDDSLISAFASMLVKSYSRKTPIV